jgi:hypothetical protein
MGSRDIAMIDLTNKSQAQNECYHKFWNRDPQIILDSINSNIALTLERFQGNTDLGLSVNKQLEKTDVVERCILTMPQGYSFNGNIFKYDTPVVVEPEPTPEPEVIVEEPDDEKG